MTGALYDGALRPIGSRHPFPYPAPAGRLLVARLLCTADVPACPDVARTCVMATGDGLATIPRRIAAELLAALGFDLIIAIIGADLEPVRFAAASLLQQAGDQ